MWHFRWAKPIKNWDKVKYLAPNCEITHAEMEWARRKAKQMIEDGIIKPLP